MTMLGNSATSLGDLIDPKKPVTIDLLSSSGDGSSATVPIVSLSDVYGLGFANGNGGGGAAKPGGGGGGSPPPDHWSSDPTNTAPLIFDVTFDSSVTGSSLKSSIEGSIKSVITDYFLTKFPTPLGYDGSKAIHIALAVGWGEAGGARLPFLALGESNTNVMKVNYSDFAKTLNQSGTVTSVPYDSSSLTLGDPLSGTHNYVMATAEARALGLTVPDPSKLTGGFDGAVGFSSKFAWTFGSVADDPAVTNAFDFVGVAEHEISEMMGRIALLGQSVTAYDPVTQKNVSVSNSYDPFDLFRFNPSTGDRSLTAGSTASFAYQDPKTTPASSFVGYLGDFNTGSGDPGDWANVTSPSGPSDAYNAAASAGIQYAASINDATVVAALGYGLV